MTIEILLPASSEMFLPLMVTSPLGAEMVMPEKALMLTVPKGELMSMLRLWLFISISYMP